MNSVCQKCGGGCCKDLWLSWDNVNNVESVSVMKKYPMFLVLEEICVEKRNYEKCICLSFKDGICKDYKTRPKFCRNFPYQKNQIVNGEFICALSKDKGYLARRKGANA